MDRSEGPSFCKECGDEVHTSLEAVAGKCLNCSGFATIEDYEANWWAHEEAAMRKSRTDMSRYRFIMIRPFTGVIFLTAYTVLLDQKMRRLIRKAIRSRLKRKVAEMLKDVPPDVKGALLLIDWHSEND